MKLPNPRDVANAAHDAANNAGNAAHDAATNAAGQAQATAEQIVNQAAGDAQKLAAMLQGTSPQVRDAAVQSAAKKFGNTFVQHLLPLLDPTGPAVNSILQVYGDVMFFIDKVHRIVNIVGHVVDSSAQVLEAAIRSGGQAVEGVLGGALDALVATLTAGGAAVPAEKVKELLHQLADAVNKGDAKAIQFLIDKAKKLGHAVASHAPIPHR